MGKNAWGSATGLGLAIGLAIVAAARASTHSEIIYIGKKIFFFDKIKILIQVHVKRSHSPRFSTFSFDWNYNCSVSQIFVQKQVQIANKILEWFCLCTNQNWWLFWDCGRFIYCVNTEQRIVNLDTRTHPNSYANIGTDDKISLVEIPTKTIKKKIYLFAFRLPSSLSAINISHTHTYQLIFRNHTYPNTYIPQLQHHECINRTFAAWMNEWIINQTVTYLLRAQRFIGCNVCRERRQKKNELKQIRASVGILHFVVLLLACLLHAHHLKNTMRLMDGLTKSKAISI